MKLYHGSNLFIDVPDLSRSKPFKDFGRGFYLSADYAQAMERARQTTDLHQMGTPCVTEFEWDEAESMSSGLKIKKFEDYSQEWAEFVFLNRDRKQIEPVHYYDIVIGPIADDGVTYQLRRFRDGDITMKTLIEKLRYAKGLTIQYFFGTKKAVSQLKRKKQ